MKKYITIGSRGSRLAEIQARSVLSTLASIYPDIKFSLTRISTRGDRQKSVPLHRISGYGVFVKEIQKALLENRIDLAVHSLKDLPVETPPGLSLAAVTERLDPRDALVTQGIKLDKLSPGSTIGTGSPRRTAQLLAYRNDLDVKEIRGNITTRLRKVSDGEVDGVIVAAAAMIRLGLEDRITEYLPLEYFLPQTGQGALGIEIRAGDWEMTGLVQPLNHEPTWRSVVAERAFLQALGGGCSTAAASQGRVSGDTLRLQGMVVSQSGILYASEEGSALAPEEIAKRLSQRLLEMGAGQSAAKER
ncbi:hydroxymethylbilane synthase [Chloroflexota bacterium]